MNKKYVQINQKISDLIQASKKINVIKQLLLESEEFKTRVASITGESMADISVVTLKNALKRKKAEYMSNITYTARILLSLFEAPIKDFDLSSFILGTKDLLNGYAEIEDLNGYLWVLSLNTGEFLKENFTEDEESKEKLPEYMKEPCSVLPKDDEYFILIKSNNR